MSYGNGSLSIGMGGILADASAARPAHHEECLTNVQLEVVSSKAVLKQSISEVSVSQGLAPGDQLLLSQLIDALPGYSDPGFLNAHRGAIVNLIQTSLPDHPVAPQAGYSAVQGHVQYSFSYAGSARGYLAAFYGSLFPTVASRAVATALAGVSPQWWANFSVAALTDAIRLAGTAQVDSQKLAGDMQAANATLRGLLAPSVLAVFQSGYDPTSITINEIAYTKRSPSIAAALAAAIADGKFVANVNAALQDPDSTQSVVWLLFTIWLTLVALEEPNVDAAIANAIKAGLEVPAQIGLPSSLNVGWWNGGYVGWFDSISGSDIAPAATGITAPLLQNETVSASASGLGGGGGAGSYTIQQPVVNGYSLSFCNWSDLNWYNPQ